MRHANRWTRCSTSTFAGRNSLKQDEFIAEKEGSWKVAKCKSWKKKTFAGSPPESIIIYFRHIIYQTVRQAPACHAPSFRHLKTSSGIVFFFCFFLRCIFWEKPSRQGSSECIKTLPTHFDWRLSKNTKMCAFLHCFGPKCGNERPTSVMFINLTLPTPTFLFSKMNPFWVQFQFSFGFGSVSVLCSCKLNEICGWAVGRRSNKVENMIEGRWCDSYDVCDGVGGGWLAGRTFQPGQLANVAGSVADKAPIEISVFLTFDTSS